MFNQYPYLNLNDLNLDYLLNEIKRMYNDVTNFVSINAIKYADPIQWNITTQYEKNTVVIDPLTGTAYISVAPVPSGVALTRTEYWTVVFDLGSFVTRAAQNFTSRWESDTTLTATFSTSAGQWLVWGDVLYKALTNITAGDQYIVGSNIEHFTIEDLYNELVNSFNLAILNIRGSIGVNELDSTVATENFDAGVLVWVGGHLYMTLTPMNVGDTFIAGTNITGVRVDSFVNDRVNNAENRLRGSIGVNELDSTVATQNFNAGVLVWVGGHLYMTLTPMNAGDTFIAGTNITSVRVDDYVLNRINDEDSLIRATLLVTNAGASNQKYLTVGANNCNFTTINAAIDYAKLYATTANRIIIFIMSGTYNEEITLLNNPGIDLIGVGKVEIQYPSAYPNSPLFFTGSMYCENITFINTNANGGSYGLHYEAQNSPTLEYQDSRFKHCVFSSFGHAGAGVGMGSGDVITFEDCLFETWTANRPALLFHNFPGDAHDQNFRCIHCRFNYQNTIAAIRVDNARARQGNSGTSNMSCQFIGCTSKPNYNYIDFVYDANDNYQGYLPLSGEVTLNTLSGDNDIIGLNIDDISLTSYHAICATNPNSSGQYVAAYLAKADCYDVTLQHVSCIGTGADITSYCSIYNKQNNQIIVNSGYTGADYANGVDVTLSLSPAKSSSLVP